jgi:DNA-binding SARP family transcriptional activator
MPPTAIRLLGGFQITREDGPVADLSGRLQALLAHVLLQPKRATSRQQLAFALWPESTDRQARTNLRRLLLLLRRALPAVDDLLEITPTGLAWRPQIPVNVDLLAFESGLATAPANGSGRRVALAAAVDAYTGDLLPDCYDEWIFPERERLRNTFAQALDELVYLAEAGRDYPAAIVYARRLLRHDPLHEASSQRLMRLLALTGDRAAALQIYHTCATLLHRELGVEPGPETRQFYDQLLGQEGSAHTRPAHSLETPPSPLVGRAVEWQMLQKAWRESSRGTPRWMLITGEAGMGKSRLAEEMLAWAERQAIPAAHARFYASTGGVGYGPIVDLLRSDTLRAGWEKLDAHWLIELSRLLPEIHTSHPHLPPPQPLAEEWQKRRLFEALAHGLVGDSRPRLLVLDDLQWADRESLDFLAFLLCHRPQARLLLVGTARSEEMLDNPALQRAIRESAAQDQLIQLPLTPLTPDETGELAAQTGGVPVDESAAHTLHDDSGGNPLFVVEMVRAGDWVPGRTTALPVPSRQSPIPNSLPPKLQAVIESRLIRLSQAAREIAAQAAVLGRSFTYPVLAAACGLDEVGLVDGLDELWQRRVIREVSGDGYDFSHDRIRDVVYGLISQARRRLLHRRAGEALLRVHGREAAEVQGQLGHHFASAGDNPAAIDHYRQAASVALERYAHAEAADYLAAAIALAESAGDAAVYPLLAERERVNRTARRTDEWLADLSALRQIVERMDDGSLEAVRRRARLRLAQHYQESLLGDRSHALVYGEEAVVLAGMAGDLVLEAEALMRTGHELWGHGRFDQAQTLLERGEAAARTAGRPALAAASLERQAQLQMFSGGSARRILSLMDESMGLYREAGDVIGEINILNKFGYLPVAQGYGDYTDALRYYLQGLAIGERIGNYAAIIMVQRNLSVLHTCQGEYGQAQAYLTQASASVQELQDGPNRPFVHNYRGFWLLQQGRLAEAKAEQEKALGILRNQKQQLWAVKAITALGWIAFYEGRWLEAEERASHGIAESEAFNEERQIAHSLTCRGWARLRLDRVDEAIPDFQRSAAILLRLEMENRAQEPLAGLAQAAWQMGDLAAAHAQALPIAHHLLTHPLDRTVDTFLAIHNCHAILRAAGDPLANEVSALAQAHLQYRAAHIEAEHLDGFWAMPGHSAWQV